MSDQPENMPVYIGRETHPAKRAVLLAIGYIFVALGAIGVFLPVWPTTPFLIVALWAFSQSSEKFHRWLYSHRWFGPYLVAWDQYRVVPLQAKIMAITFMALGWAIFTTYYANSWHWPAVIGVVELLVAAYLLSKPNRIPTAQDSE